MTAARTMAYRFESPLAVTAHTAVAPSDEEWSAYVADIAALPNLEDFRVLVISEGGGPTARQRSELTDVFSGRPAVTAVMTNGRLMRSIGTAISWFNPRLKVFGMDEADRALEHLRLSHEQTVRLLELLRGAAKDVSIAVPPALLSGVLQRAFQQR